MSRFDSVTVGGVSHRLEKPFFVILNLAVNAIKQNNMPIQYLNTSKMKSKSMATMSIVAASITLTSAGLMLKA